MYINLKLDLGFELRVTLGLGSNESRGISDTWDQKSAIKSTMVKNLLQGISGVPDRKPRRQ